MTLRIQIAAAALAILAACSEEELAELPPAHALSAEATGYYCGMLLAEHEGPKGQILLESRNEPVWFSSVRDTFIFLQLPEEPKDIAAVYVSDMAKAPSWERPGSGNWVLAKDAFFVVDSDRQGAMGGAEAIPFSREGAAQAFVREHAGRIERYEEVTKRFLAAAPGG